MNRDKNLGVFIIGFFAVVALVSSAAYQQGYDQAKAECRAPIDMKIKPMTYKQQVRWAKWAMREREVVR